MVDIEKIVENLINICADKELILEKLYLLTVQQTESIEEEDMESLTVLIDNKQCEIDKIRQLDIQFETIINDLKTIYDVKTLDELEIKCSRITELKVAIERVMTALRKTTDLEVKNKEELTEKKDALEKKINHAGSGKKAMSSYGGGGIQSPAVFFDKKIK